MLQFSVSKVFKDPLELVAPQWKNFLPVLYVSWLICKYKFLESITLFEIFDIDCSNNGKEATY